MWLQAQCNEMVSWVTPRAGFFSMCISARLIMHHKGRYDTYMDKKRSLEPRPRQELARASTRRLQRAGFVTLPGVILDAGEQATKAFLEFFLATIRNKNTRMAYARAVASSCSGARSGG